MTSHKGDRQYGRPVRESLPVLRFKGRRTQRVEPV